MQYTIYCNNSKNLTSDDFNEGIALNEISVEFIKDCVENPEGVEPCA